MNRSKAFFVNGGYGRMISSIPAFELYAKTEQDPNFIIVCEGGTDAFKGHPELDHRAYDSWHKNLFREKIRDKEIVTTEPYRVFEYYNQQCSLSQAFDIQINNQGIRNIPQPKLFLSKEELITGRKVVNDVKEKLKQEKTIVFQPFGRGVKYIDQSFVDSSGRSIEFTDFKKIISLLQKEKFAVICMSEMVFDFSKDKFENDVAMPEQIPLRIWASVIKYADHFLGCDSVGQHLSHAVDTTSTVVVGATFPINVSYPGNSNIEIVDLGMHDRIYDPIRILPDEYISRANENIMRMTPEIHEYILDRILRKPKDPDDT
tara:strand:- start:211 stop:1161 length:951 start_codon:yes stop_codon:yes gene_type:complete